MTKDKKAKVYLRDIPVDGKFHTWVTTGKVIVHGVGGVLVELDPYEYPGVKAVNKERAWLSSYSKVIKIP